MELVCKTLGDCFRNREHWWLPCEMFSGTTFILNGCKERKKLTKACCVLGYLRKKKIYSGSPDTRLELVKLLTC